MNFLWAVALLTLMGVVLASPSPEKREEGFKAQLSRRGKSCIAENRVYRHGEIFTLGDAVCIKYLCDNGNYNFFEEGCYKWNQCFKVNEPKTYECRDYMCYESYVGGYKGYVLRPVSNQKCKDMSGACHTPGKLFRYYMEGEWKNQCSCRPEHDVIRYYCYD